MPSQTVDIGEFIISNGAQVSSLMDFRGWRRNASAVIIEGPGTLTGIARVQNSFDNGTTWKDVQSAGADISIPADGSVTIKSVHRTLYRIFSDSVEGGIRTLKVQAEESY